MVSELFSAMSAYKTNVVLHEPFQGEARLDSLVQTPARAASADFQLQNLSGLGQQRVVSITEHLWCRQEAIKEYSYKS